MLRRVAQFSIWQAAGQAISAASLFLLAWLLPATALATFGYALSISSLLSAVVTLRLEQAVLVAESEEDAALLAWCALTSATAICVFIVAATVVFDRYLNALPLAAGALSALSISAVTISQQVLIRNARSSAAGRLAAVRAFLIAAVVSGFAFVASRDTARGALVGLIVAAVLVTLSCLYELMKSARLEVRLSRFDRVIRTYRDVWSSYLGQSILSAVSLNAPYVAFFHVVDHRLVASYLLADRLARTPIAALSSSVRSHLTHLYVGLLRENRMREGKQGMKRWTATLGLTGLIGLLVVSLATYLAANYYGSQKWAGAAAALAMLIIWAASTLSNPPAAATLTASRKNAFILRAQGVEVSSRLAIVAVVIPFAPSHFYLGLFLIHLPGVFYNLALYTRATRVWAPVHA